MFILIWDLDPYYREEKLKSLLHMRKELIYYNDYNSKYEPGSIVVFDQIRKENDLKKIVQCSRHIPITLIISGEKTNPSLRRSADKIYGSENEKMEEKS